MPELPDITVYLEALERRVVGQVLAKVRVLDVFVLRTAVPPIASLEGTRVTALRRLGKRIAFGFGGDRWLVLHLMIAGRLQWTPSTGSGQAPSTGSGQAPLIASTPVRRSAVAGGADPGRMSAKPPAFTEPATGKPGPAPPATARPKIPNALAQFFFATGTLTLTEAGSKHRASLHVVAGEAGLAAHDRGGLDVFAATPAEFGAALTGENHTLKRALTDPRLFSGIGNAYSDEILHAARLSPVALTSKLSATEVRRLHAATQQVLALWTERLRAEAGDGFPAKVTAFRPEMAVHGKFGQPCPVCGTKVQRIRYAENEVNYCPRCQTGGKLLADRSLSRLLKGDWPKTIDEAEELGRA